MKQIVFFAAGLAAIATAPFAHAQATNVRSFVSAASGLDANPCTRAAPCRTFQAALGATAARGEIVTLDPGGYGAVTINKSISIVSGVGEAQLTAPAAGAGVTINAGPDDVVSLRGLTIDGVGVGQTGIALTGGLKSLTIQKFVIRNLTSSGIALAPTVAGKSTNIAISDTVLSDNGGHGVYLQPADGASAYAVFNRVEVYNNALTGFAVYGNLQLSAGTTLATAIDSVAAGNNIGFECLGAVYGIKVQFFVHRSTAFNNAVGVTGTIGSISFAFNNMIISQSNIQGNTTAVANQNATYGDSYTGGQSLNYSFPRD